MATIPPRSFLSGVIEGFYGPPWTPEERADLFASMQKWGLNTYLYSPKDDLKHRAIWRELYSTEEAGAFASLIRACHQRGIQFVYALAPGLDIRYTRQADVDRLRERAEQMAALGCTQFALLFDDIPDRMDPADIARFGSLAAAQCAVANAFYQWTREHEPQAALFFCPTPYCGRMASRSLGGEGYLEEIGRGLSSGIDIFWTGPDIISREITVGHIREVAEALRRKPVIWDNLHANDYDGRRFYCGPYSGRPLELRDEVRGLLSNPNCEYQLNHVALRTLAAFVNCQETWDERAEYLRALKEWLVFFGSVGTPISFEDLVRLGDCYYLPHNEGPQAEALLGRMARVLASELNAREGEVARLREDFGRWRAFFGQLSEIRNRPLFNALFRRLWDLREELDLAERYIEFKSRPENRNSFFRSDFHQLGTYRGGVVARLQRELMQESDGSFHPMRHPKQQETAPALSA